MNKEELLIEGCKKGVRSAQRVLYESYYPVLLRICTRYASSKEEAEDWLHDIFIKIFDKIKAYRGEGSFEGFLKRLTANFCLTELKRNQKQYFEPIQDVSDIEEEIVDSEISDITIEDVEKALVDIPRDFAIVFSLHIIDGFSHKEIAEQLKIPSATCRTRVHRAKQLIQKELLRKQESRI